MLTKQIKIELENKYREIYSNQPFFKYANGVHVISFEELAQNPGFESVEFKSLDELCFYITFKEWPTGSEPPDTYEVESKVYNCYYQVIGEVENTKN